MLDEDTKRQIKNLPPNWWKSIEACSSFLDHFKNYMVTLFISYHLSNKSIQTIFTGFLLYFEDLPLWISAGHVIEDIRNVLQNSDVKIQEMAWLDNHENPKASAVIVSNKDLQTYSSFNDGIDFGAIVIGSWEARQIASNNSNLWFTAQAWKNLEKAQPEGYYLVGYPTSYNKTTNMGKVGNKVKKVFEAAVVCLPIEKIDYGELTENQKGRWKEKDSFFGRIVDMENVEAPEDIRGMSGGPIVSIERDPTGYFRYRLFGVQSAWFKSTKTIKAESIPYLLKTVLKKPDQK